MRIVSLCPQVYRSGHTLASMPSSSVIHRSKDLRLAKVNAPVSSLHIHVAGAVRRMLVSDGCCGVLHLPPVLVAICHCVSDVCNDFQR